jgi:hypothetical protein
MSENIYRIARELEKEKPTPSFEDYLNHYYEEKAMVCWHVSGKSKLYTGEEILDSLENYEVDFNLFQNEVLDEAELEAVADELGMKIAGEYCSFAKQKVKNGGKNLFDLVFFKVID